MILSKITIIHSVILSANFIHFIQRIVQPHTNECEQGIKHTMIAFSYNHTLSLLMPDPPLPSVVVADMPVHFHIHQYFMSACELTLFYYTHGFGTVISCNL